MPVIKSMIFKCLCFPPHFQHFIIVLRELLDNYPKFLRHQFSKHKLLSCTLKSWVEVIFVAVVQSLCPLFVTPWAATHQASLSFTISQSLLKLMPIQSVTPSNHLILCHPLLLLPSVLPSIRVSYWPRLTACGILVPWPGMEPMPSAVEACWTTREAPRMSSFCFQTFMIINSSIICLSLTHSIRSIAYQLVCMEGFISPNALNNCWAWLNNVTALCVSGMNVCESVFSLITIFVRSVVFVCSCYFV